MNHLGAIAIFVAAADAGSFASAAAALGVTPSAVSKAVARLEAHLGVHLFLRSTRSIELTDDGRAFLDRARPGLSEIEAAQEFLMQRRAIPRGRLRVSMPVAFGHLLVAPLIPEIAETYPELDIETHSTDEFCDLVEDGYDVLIRTGRLKDTSFVARKLIDTRFMTAASPGYLASHGTPRTLNDLTGHKCFAYVFPSTQRRFAWPFQVNGEPTTVPPSGAAAFTNADAMLRAAAVGGGLAHLQDYMVRPYVEAGHLVEVLRDHAADGGPVSAIYQKSRHLSPRVRSFVDFLAQRLAPSATNNQDGR